MRSKLWAAFAAAALALLVGSCASRTEDTRDGIADAARTPFRDVGLIRPEIPVMLRTLDYPYSTVTLAPGCSAVAYEIAQLDAILGTESFQPGPDRNIWDRGGDFVENQAIDAMVGTAQDLIPFRSWVRRLSGASEAEREALRAFANGQQRRTFLRGYGASLGCNDMIPAPPPPPPPEDEDDDGDRNNRN
jgi:hypothetical protein